MSPMALRDTDAMIESDALVSTLKWRATYFAGQPNFRKVLCRVRLVAGEGLEPPTPGL